MPCTTILVGKKASHDGSTIIARTDDGYFEVKKLVSVDPKRAPKTYTSVLSHVTVTLPDEALRYTMLPTVDPKEGLWPACGINSANVGMTATETITTNPRVLAADPLVTLRRAEKRGEKETPGGIGEEDLVVLVLPYIRSAREGVIRLGKLLEEYGTYESNGIAFSDSDEIWWLETIGGHHWIARRVPDEVCAILPNRFGMDSFDLADALGPQETFMCSVDLKDWMISNHLYPDVGDIINPRDIFGSHSDNDRYYNNPRAWFMGRTIAPRTYNWDGPNADYTPESHDIPWALVPERLISVEDVKYILGSHYQGTPYDPYTAHDSPERGKYRPIGIPRTGDTGIITIRGDLPEAVRAVEWICLGPTTFNAALPVFTQGTKVPDYLGRVGLTCSTENFYWCSRLIAELADPHFGAMIPTIERYQEKVFTECRTIIEEIRRLPEEEMTEAALNKANERLCAAAKGITDKTLGEVILKAGEKMRCMYSRIDL